MVQLQTFDYMYLAMWFELFCGGVLWLEVLENLMVAEISVVQCSEL